MNNIQKRRLYGVLFVALGLSLAAGFILYALRQNINAFYTPTQMLAEHPLPEHYFRLGGMVKKGSVVREKDSLIVQFTVTDFKHDIRVQYNGILPDLFREGKGVITEGKLNTDNQFIASQVLAKHDENYTPMNMKGTT